MKGIKLTLPQLRAIPLRETSPLMSPRDSANHVHKLAGRTARLLQGVQQNAKLLQHQSNGVPKMVRTDGFGMHPFRIYQVPYTKLTQADVPTYETVKRPDWLWRTFRVRGGYNLTSVTDYETATQATGTDGLAKVAYMDVFQWDFYTGTTTAGTSTLTGTAITPTAITVPSSIDYYWFWYDSTDNAVHHGYNGQLPGYPNDDDGFPDVSGGSDPVLDGWDSFPQGQAGIFPLGYVDTKTLKSQGMAVVRQFQMTDIIAGGIELVVCDPATGTEKTIIVNGYEKPAV